MWRPTVELASLSVRLSLVGEPLTAPVVAPLTLADGPPPPRRTADARAGSGDDVDGGAEAGDGDDDDGDDDDARAAHRPWLGGGGGGACATEHSAAFAARLRIPRAALRVWDVGRGELDRLRRPQR